MGALSKKNRWAEVASASLSEIMAILESAKVDSTKLYHVKGWLNDSLLLETNLVTQRRLYAATQARKKEAFRVALTDAVRHQREYIDSLGVNK